MVFSCAVSTETVKVFEKLNAVALALELQRRRKCEMPNFGHPEISHPDVEESCNNRIRNHVHDGKCL